MNRLNIRLSLIIAIISAFCPTAFCQPKTLSVGDQCPNIMIKHIINYKTSEASIEDFKGKLLILDFWATWCAPCISMFPVGDSLQEEFKDKLQIIAVTDQDSGTVSGFFNNMNRIRHLKPVSATGDTLLSSLFKHVEIPHYVWIGENRKVIAITNAKHLTRSNIENALRGYAMDLPVKKDKIKIINEEKPFFAMGNELINGNQTQFEKLEDGALLYHSIITKSIEGFGSEDGSFENKLESKNSSIGGLYRFAAGHGKLQNLFLNSTIWEATNQEIKAYTDSAALTMDRESKTEFWMKNHTFCYELIFPETLKEKRFEIMLADLNNYFGARYNIEGQLELRNTNCLALTKIAKGVSLTTSGLNENTIFNEYHIKLSNKSIASLINYLGINLDLLPPLVDETGYNGNIDIELNCDISDVDSLNKSLIKYGLQLKEKILEHHMIVIKNKDKFK